MVVLLGVLGQFSGKVCVPPQLIFPGRAYAYKHRSLDHTTKTAHCCTFNQRGYSKWVRRKHLSPRHIPIFRTFVSSSLIITPPPPLP